MALLPHSLPEHSNIGLYASLTPAHETGAVIFTVNAILQVCKTLDIKLWFNLSDLKLF